MNSARKPDRLSRELASLQLRADAASIAFVENQVEHMQYSAEPLCPLLTGWQRKWDAGSLDALLGPADPLRHGRLRHQECVREFGSGQPAHGAQRQGNCR